MHDDETTTMHDDDDTVNIVTNFHPRPVLGWDDLTDDERADLDYVTDTEEWWGFRYRGSVYDLHEFERVPKTGRIADALRRHNFVGWQTQSYFDGIAIRWTDRDDEWLEDGCVAVAHVHW